MGGRSVAVVRDPRLSKVAIIILCLVVPPLMMVALLAWEGVYPFGDTSFLTMDLMYQYIDFYAWFKRVLAGQASIFYTSSLSLGTNAWGIYSYYLGSPLNLLVVLFDDTHLTDFVILTDAMKLGLIQLAGTWYLRRRFDLPRAQAFALALCLTWSEWTFTNLRNPLWLDSLYLLPVAMLGTWECLRGEGGGKLVAAVALSVICCWYMAYMTCLFLVFYALVELVVLHVEGELVGLKPSVRRLLAVVGRMVAGVLVSAWTFVPTVLSFSGGSAGLMPEKLSACSPRDLVAGFFAGTCKVDSVPQLFSGTLQLVLGCLFLLDRRNANRVRLATLLLMVALMASVGITWAELVWCGFRMPNGFYSRTAVFVTVLLVWASGWELSRVGREGVSRRVLVVPGILVGLVSCLPLVSHVYQQGWYVFVSLAGIAVSCLLTGLMGRHADAGGPGEGHSSLTPSLCLCLLCAAELFWCAHLVAPQLYGGQVSQDFNDTYTADSTQGLADLRADDGDAWRMDKTYTRAGLAASDEGLAQGYSALSSYCSSNNAAAIRLLNALGYSNPGEFSVRYASPIPLSDSLLGVRYVWCAGPTPLLMEETGVRSSLGGWQAYRNPLALPLGYGASDAALEALTGVDDSATTASANPFEVQNRLVSAILGQDVEVFKPVVATKTVTSDDQWSWHVDASDDAQLYYYLAGGYHIGNMVSVDDSEANLENWRFTHTIEPVGRAGQAHDVSITAAVPDNDYMQNRLTDETCLFYELDEGALRETLGRIGAHGMEVETFDDGHIAGTYQADEDGLLLLTVPWDRGWTVTVNGQEVEPRQAFDGAMMAIPVGAGESQVELTYISPGLAVGCVASVATCLLLLLRFIWGHRRARAAGV